MDISEGYGGWLAGKGYRTPDVGWYGWPESVSERSASMLLPTIDMHDQSMGS